MHALKKWRHYLLSQVFELVTDHKSLKGIFTQPDLNMRQRQWVEFLQEFSFEIKYKPGKGNQATNALSGRDTFFGPLILEIPSQREHKSLEDYT